LNSDFKVEIPVSEMTPPLRELALWPVAGALGEHDAKTKPAAAAATTMADRAPRRLRQATRIPVRFLSPATSMTPPSMPRHARPGHGVHQELAHRPTPGPALSG